jgi:glycosyltransferase involved in cell wall biosynthesis
MRKKILVVGPVLSRSGYGEQARFAIRSLRQYEDKYDIYAAPTNWGQLSWTWEDTEERRWMDSVIQKTMIYESQSQGVHGHQKYDISLQVTIPNEWTSDKAAYNVGYTAGIETDRVAPIWIQKCMEMDKIIVVSNHSKDVFYNTSYTMQDQNGTNMGELKLDKENIQHPEVVAVNYPVKESEVKKFEHKFPTKFNFLTVSQWGTRKNLESTIGWFVQEFKDNEDVGLIVKTSMRNTSNIDRQETKNLLQKLLSSENLEGRKCKVYLLHGDMTEEEMNGLYQHRSVKGFINIAHGEGFGLPMFEAAYHKVPVIAMGWSGHMDFLYAPDKKGSKKSKKKMIPYFGKVSHEIGTVQPQAVWDGVIEKQSCWAYPKEKSYKIVLRDVYENHAEYKKKAVELDKYLRSKFTNANQYKQFADAVYEQEEFDVEDWLGSLGEEVFE